MAFSRWHASRTLAIVLLCGWSPLLWALSESPSNEYELNISSGLLIEAIKQFSEQTDVQYTVDSQATAVDVLRIEGFRARLSARAALARILAGSDLSADWQGDHTVRIYSEVVVAPHGLGNVKEIVVTGSRLGGGEGPAPVRVYTREDIDRFGVSSLPGLATYMTQQSFSFGEESQRSGAQHFQMRGLGLDTTLVLINGRRAPPGATSVSLNAFDLNTIPLTAVDRIEVMSDSASAIYGADAIGGVVNIILKKNIETPDLYFHYGAAAGGADERRIAAAIGSTAKRFKSSLTLDYFERGMLIGAKRDIWRNQDYRRFGGQDFRLTTATPGNVYSTTGQPLPGLGASNASVPVGSTGVGLTPDDFLATAGVESLRSSNETWSIVPETTRSSAFGSAEVSLSEAASIFGEVLWTKGNIVSQTGLPFLLGQIVPATNPYNPFGEPVAVDYSLVGMQPLSNVTESRFNRFVLGARGGLLRNWDWEMTLISNDERVDSERIGNLDINKVQAALESTDPQTALNPFADGPAGSDALLSSLVAEPQALDSFSGGLQFSGFLRGRLFEMRGGKSEFVAGAEWRRENIKYINILALEHERDVTSGFAELKLPLFDRVTVKLALRGDYYENARDSINPQYGVVWRPSHDWLVRAAYSTSFRPPSLPEQYDPRSEFVFSISDPRRGDTVSPVRFSGGGNPELDNISAESFTAGLMYRPDKSPGLHFGAHYWRVVMDNRIFAPRFSDLDEIEEAMPERVVRAARTENDRLNGWLGALQAVDLSVANFGRLQTSGIDLDLAYHADCPRGRAQAALSATWVDEYLSQEIGAVLPVDRVGIANLQGTIPEWRVVGSVAWDGNWWGGSTTATYTPRYHDAGPTGVLTRDLRSRTLVDMQVWIALGQVFDSGAFDGLSATVGVQNLFDREVDFAYAGLAAGYDVSQASLKQRFTYLRVTKAF